MLLDVGKSSSYTDKVVIATMELVTTCLSSCVAARLPGCLANCVRASCLPACQPACRLPAGCAPYKVATEKELGETESLLNPQLGSYILI